MLPDSPLPCRTVQSRPIDDPDPEIRAHRHLCAACGQAAAALRASWEAMGAVPDREPSPQFAMRVRAKIDQTTPGPWFDVLGFAGGHPVRWLALAGGVAVVVLVSSLWLTGEQPGAPGNGSDAVAELELLESQDLFQNLEVVEDLDLLLMMDEG